MIIKQLVVHQLKYSSFRRQKRY